MPNYPYKLEQSSKKYLCPKCQNKSFKRIVETVSGSQLPDHVGRCDHESSCGYEYTWKQYLVDNPNAGNGHFGHTSDTIKKPRKTRIPIQGLTNKNSLQADSDARFSAKKPEYLGTSHLLETLTDYDQNSFVQFLLKLFPNDSDDVSEAIKEYLIGTLGGFTVFPTITKTKKVCKAKLIRFDPDTGKRIKDGYSITSLEAKLKKAGKLHADFETDKTVFFGEHLLSKYPGLPVAVVESEKTAVIAAITKGAFPFDFVWLATGSKSWLKVDRLRRLGRNRNIVLYPDADGFDKWQAIASDASKQGLTVNVSSLIERQATDAEKAKQVDLADYLISAQTEINGINAKIESVKNDPALLYEFEMIAEERKAILIYDGGMSETQAESYVSTPKFIREAVLSL